MTPEEYLRNLGRESFGGILVEQPNLEIFNTIQLFVEAITQSMGVEGEGSFQPTLGPDSHLLTIRDELIPYFPPTVQDTLYEAPAGYIYDVDPNGFAVSVPDGGEVVCLNMILENLLLQMNSCVHMFPPEMTTDFNKVVTKMIKYAAAKTLHHIMGLLHECASMPLPASVKRPYIEVMHQSTYTTNIQIRFLIAHEYSHISLGHLKKRTERGTSAFKVQELDADELGAQVMLGWMKANGLLTNNELVELILGMIYAIFYMGEAILDVREIYRPVQRAYPSAEIRFNRVIEQFRKELGADLMGSGVYMLVPAHICQLCAKMKSNPDEAIIWLSDMAMACQDLDDRYEEVFILSQAREIAIKAGDATTARQIGAYIDTTIMQEKLSPNLLDWSANLDTKSHDEKPTRLEQKKIMGYRDSYLALIDIEGHEVSVISR